MSSGPSGPLFRFTYHVFPKREEAEDDQQRDYHASSEVLLVIEATCYLRFFETVLMLEEQCSTTVYRFKCALSTFSRPCIYAILRHHVTHILDI